MNRSRAALARKGMVPGGTSLECPACGRRLEFGADRLGHTVEYCVCGHSQRVGRRAPDPPDDTPPRRAAS